MKKILSLILCITLLFTVVTINVITTNAQVGDKFVFEAEDCVGEYDSTSKISYSTGSYSGWNADCTALDSAKQKFIIHGNQSSAAIGQYITFNLTRLEQGNYELYFGHRYAAKNRATYAVEAWDSSNTVQSAGDNIDFLTISGTNVKSFGSYFYSVKASNKITVTEGNSLTLKMTITALPENATSAMGFYIDKILLVKTSDNGGTTVTEGSTTDSESEESSSTTTTTTTTKPLATMNLGASIRLGDINGIRFYTKVDTTKIDELKAVDGNKVELGTLIAPADNIQGKELSFDLETGKYVDVKFNSATYYTEGEFTGIVGSLVNIQDKNITRDFVGRGYVKVTDKDNKVTITYADYAKGTNEVSSVANNTRSLKTIALAMQKDTENFSKLTEAQQAMVKAWAEGKAYN